MTNKILEFPSCGSNIDIPLHLFVINLIRYGNIIESATFVVLTLVQTEISKGHFTHSKKGTRYFRTILLDF